MADKPPAPLSSSLLARKGAASAGGFALADGGPVAAPSARRWRLTVFSTTLSISVAVIAFVGAALMFGGPWTPAAAPEPTARVPATPTSAVTEFAAVPALPAAPLRAEAPRAIELATAPFEPAAVALAAGETAPPPPPATASPTPPATASPTPGMSPGRTAEQTEPPPPNPRRRPAGPARAGYRVQLHALASDAAVRREWRRLRRRHGELFAGLNLTVAPKRSDGGGGTVYRMRLGALSSRTEARALCDKLRRKAIGCMVVR